MQTISFRAGTIWGLSLFLLASPLWAEQEGGNRTTRRERIEKRRAEREKTTPPPAQGPTPQPAKVSEQPTGRATVPAPASAKKISFPVAYDVSVQEARQLAQRAVELYSGLQLSPQHYGPWVIVHGLLGLGTAMQVRNPEGAGNSQSLPALQWLSNGAVFEQYPAFLVTPYGARGYSYSEQLRVAAGALEGHPNQFIGYLSELQIPLNTPWKAWNDQSKRWDSLTLADVLTDAKSQTGINPVPNTVLEHTWTLWALANYEDPDVRWNNSRGEAWSIEKLISFELQQGINPDTSCAGHHRLYALFVAVQKYVDKHGKLPAMGPYQQAWKYVWDHARRAQDWQNADGSFSAKNYFSQAMATNWEERLAADGHTLEFLVGIFSAERLSEPWLLRGVATVASDLLETRAAALNGPAPSWGGTFHALHALREFLRRTQSAGGAQ